MVLSREYHNTHYAVRTARGRASEHICECGNPAVDWAHIHDTDPNDPVNYTPKCRSCHMFYDNPKQGSRNSEAKISEADVIEIREMYATGNWLQREIGELFGIGQCQVSHIIRGNGWRHV
jgi:predicted XRE-type DNA-binding protein